MELLAEGQQLEEELRQIVDYTQGTNLARFRISSTRHTGSVVDVCMIIMMHVYPVMTLKNKYYKYLQRDLLNFQKHSLFMSYFFFTLIFYLDFYGYPCVCLPSRRLSSFVWNGCRLMNSYVRSPRATDQLTGREETEGREGEGIMQTAVPTPLHPLYMAVALTMVEGVDAEATATALDMVGAF